MVRMFHLAAALTLVRIAGATAFPLLDASTPGQVPQGTELAAPDAQDLQHQLQIVNGLASPAAGWTFVPRIDYQEMLTDNVLQQHKPRQWDLVTYLSPGFSLDGDLPRLSLHFSYAPALAIYTRDGPLNALTEQLNGIGLVTLAPDLAYLDIRAVSGVQNAYGGVGGLGGLGATSAATSQSAIPSLAGNAQGLTKDNEVQTTSIAISPYLLGRFGDWGTGRAGYSFNVTRSNTLSGFFEPPYPTDGANAQTLISNEENAHFVSGDILERFQDSFDIDMLQSQTTSGAAGTTPFDAIPSTPSINISRRAVVSDQVTYKVSRSLAVFASGGHEDIDYSSQGGQPFGGVYVTSNPISIHDLIWSLGITWTPGPSSQLTVSYGHLNGFNSTSVDGYYALTPRTLLTVSYGSTLGTQLENLRNQLNLTTASNSGSLVNGQTGGQLYGNANALPIQNGVYRTNTLSLGSQTTLDRDIITVNLLMATQTNAGGGSLSNSAVAKTVAATWVHQMRPDMTLNAGLAFSIQDQSVAAGLTPGNSTSFVASLGWQYQISSTVSASLRYSLFERHSSDTAFSFYQNILILGLSKTF